LALEHLGHPFLPEILLYLIQISQPLGEAGAEVKSDLRGFLQRPFPIELKT
jgi:hypothetical protein